MSRWRFGLLVVCAAPSACGARTELSDRLDASRPGAFDAGPVEDVASGACIQGVNTEHGVGTCASADPIDWFATPYAPPIDITVERIEAHMAQGDVALLASVANAPGAVLFVGSVGTSPEPAWIGAEVRPPVVLHGGTHYFIAFHGDCSFGVGGPYPTEYMAPSVEGPWHTQGVDNWTARLIGACP